MADIESGLDGKKDDVLKIGTSDTLGSDMDAIFPPEIGEMSPEWWAEILLKSVRLADAAKTEDTEQMKSNELNMLTLLAKDPSRAKAAILQPYSHELHETDVSDVFPKSATLDDSTKMRRFTVIHQLGFPDDDIIRVAANLLITRLKAKDALS